LPQEAERYGQPKIYFLGWSKLHFKFSVEDVMAIGQSMLPEFDHEMANTRKTLESVPDNKFQWKPHDKSFPMGALATHLANLAGWTNVTIDMDEFDMAPG